MYLPTILVAIVFLVSTGAQFVEDPTKRHKFAVTDQGADRCPDPAFAGAVLSGLEARSVGECGVGCIQRHGCLSFSFHNDTKTCDYFYTTPSKLVHTEQCIFMVASILLGRRKEYFCIKRIFEFLYKKYFV